MKNKLNLIATILTLIFFVSCNTKKTKSEEVKEVKTEEVKHTKKDCKDAHWSHHKGEDGPENWKNLCDGFSDCGENSQSPINIVTTNIVSDSVLVAPKFSYDKSKVAIINNGHTLQFNIDEGSSVNLNGKEYQLLQFHYHALSEHTINGKYSPIEVHFVHKHSDTDFAVLGIMYKEGKENNLFTKYLNDFPTKKGNFKSDKTIDLLNLFPKNKSYFNYSGSLTTPPCSEVVNWHVLKTPVEASKEQIEAFSKILHNNFRPIQPLNDRTVRLYGE